MAGSECEGLPAVGEGMGIDDMAPAVKGADLSPSHKQAPLERFRVIGIVEKTVGINAGTPAARMVPSGQCWHCGTEIRICVQAKNLDTDEVVDIGTTCAERIGLDPKGLKKYLVERFAEERHLRSRAARDAQQAEYAKREAEFEAQYGPHGSETRYDHCNVWGYKGVCDACHATMRRLAPHGTWTCFYENRCSCGPCVEAAMAHDKNFKIVDLPVLIDLGTGEVVETAEIRNGRYGSFWSVSDYGSTVPAYAKKRETVAKRGYTYASADFLVYDNQSNGRGRGYSKQRRLTMPEVDDWGEPIVKSA